MKPDDLRERSPQTVAFPRLKRRGLGFGHFRVGIYFLTDLRDFVRFERMDENLRSTLLEVIESSLEAQLRAVRRLRSPIAGVGKTVGGPGKPKKTGMSQVDMAYAILLSGQPMHIKDLLEAIHARFGTQVDRESLVSALSKRVARGDRFERVAKNTFSLITPRLP